MTPNPTVIDTASTSSSSSSLLSGVDKGKKKSRIFIFRCGSPSMVIGSNRNDDAAVLTLAWLFDHRKEKKFTVHVVSNDKYRDWQSGINKLPKVNYIKIEARTL